MVISLWAFRHLNKVLGLIILCLAISSCKKVRIELDQNPFIPLNKDLFRDQLGDFLRKNNNGQEVIKIVSLDDGGALLLLNTTAGFSLLKLSNSGYGVMYYKSLEYYASDLVVHNDIYIAETNNIFLGSKASFYPEQGNIHVYDLTTGEEKLVFHPGGAAGFKSMYYDMHSRQLYFGGNTTSRTPLLCFKRFDNTIDSLINFPFFFCRISQIIGGSSDSMLYAVYDSLVGQNYYKNVKSINKYTNELNEVAFSGKKSFDPNPQFILATDSDKIVAVLTQKDYSTFPTFYIKSFFANGMSDYSIQIKELDNHCLIKDIIISNDTIYACGISHYNKFANNGNVVGNACLIRIYNHNVDVYSFGDEKYLSSFNCISLKNRILSLGGFKGRYFESDNYNVWFSNFTACIPMFVQVNIEDLK